MSASVDILNPDRPKRIVIVASNPAVSEQTGWPIGFWWAELSHPFFEFSERGYQVDIASPEGGPLQADAFSDPRDKSGYSAEDLISLGFINSPAHIRLVEESKPLADVSVEAYNGALTGQQQYSGREAARLMIEALGT
jgi:putative intracellular protease/amidase